MAKIVDDIQKSFMALKTFMRNLVSRQEDIKNGNADVGKPKYKQHTLTSKNVQNSKNIQNSGKNPKSQNWLSESTRSQHKTRLNELAYSMDKKYEQLMKLENMVDKLKTLDYRLSSSKCIVGNEALPEDKVMENYHKNLKKYWGGFG